MVWLAFKTMLREKARFAIALTGVVVAAILALLQVAMYLGAMANATAVIRHTPGDIWIANKNIQTFDFALPFPAERIDRVRSHPDVEWARAILLTWGYLKLANGGREQVQIVGFDPDHGIGQPWRMASGVPADLKGGNYMLADEGSANRLGALERGSLWELDVVGRSHAFKLVGLSSGIRSFTTSPVLFVSYERLQVLLAQAGIGRQAAFIVVKAARGADAGRVAAALGDALEDNDVLTRGQFVARSIRYWTIQTGLGLSFFVTALLAVVIGSTILGQTIHSSTLAHLREYGTLKAIGARNRDVAAVVVLQAAASGLAGYALAALAVGLAAVPLQDAGVPLHLDAAVFLGMFAVLMGACVGSAWFSVARVRTLDPVTVFKA